MTPKKLQETLTDAIMSGEQLLAETVRMAEEWDRAVIQAVEAAKRRGNVPKSMQRLADSIARPKKSWRQILRDFLRDVASQLVRSARER